MARRRGLIHRFLERSDSDWTAESGGERAERAADADRSEASGPSRRPRRIGSRPPRVSPETPSSVSF